MTFLGWIFAFIFCENDGIVAFWDKRRKYRYGLKVTVIFLLFEHAVDDLAVILPWTELIRTTLFPFADILGRPKTQPILVIQKELIPDEHLFRQLYGFGPLNNLDRPLDFDSPPMLLNYGHMLVFLLVRIKDQANLVDFAFLVLAQLVVVLDRFEEGLQLVFWQVILVVLFVRAPFAYVVVAVRVFKSLALLFQDLLVDSLQFLVLLGTYQAFSARMLFLFDWRHAVRFRLRLLPFGMWSLFSRFLPVLSHLFWRQHTLNILTDTLSNTCPHPQPLLSYKRHTYQPFPVMVKSIRRLDGVG